MNMLTVPILVAFVFGVVVCDDDETMALKFLSHYGYISPTLSGNHDVPTAIRKFQEYFGLEVSGILDAPTINLMRKPRCGDPDDSGNGNRVRRFATRGKWSKAHLTYYVQPGQDLSVGLQKQIFAEALKFWANVSGLSFSEVSSAGSADLKISFGSRSHSGTNVESTCRRPFDGPSSVLAHAFFPPDGRSHYDEDETFTHETPQGINLLWVATHEFGHSLGLAHTNFRDAVMYPYYTGYAPGMKLHSDDIAGIQSLYGPNTGGGGGTDPDLVAFFPLDAAYGTKEIKNRVAQGVPSGVSVATGPGGTANSSYEFAGTADSYIEFVNSEGGPLDVRHSMTMLCWVYYIGQDGPLFNYKTSGHWGVHLWVVADRLFVRFTHRDYSFTGALLHTHLAGGWKFVGASYDGGSGDAKLWVNGAVVQTLNIGAGLDLATQDNIRMGVKDGDVRYFKGRIAQMQVYSSALSQERIERMYKMIEDLVAFFPLNATFGTDEIKNRVAQGVPFGVNLAPGPDGTADSAYEFTGTPNSYIEFVNSEGWPLDVRHSMTMLCWVYYSGQDGPLFNYKTSGHWGVHLWVVADRLFVRFTHRDYSFTGALLHTHLAGGWKFVGASYDGGSGDAKLWVNGAVVQALNIGAGLDLATQDNIRMGVKDGDVRYFKGRITQMQVYSSALSQEQIQAIYKRIQAV